MRLKRLELHGFKSFADPTSFEFGDDTLTGIVGPNGCGKSNVVDAVRWVLGEQRPTSMRGKEMTDVIFKGCASRPGMGVCEVTLVLDNSSGTLEDRGAEVAVTRRVYKSGEGEYRIDGAKVRLKDVKEMLFDTGLGSRGYSVLEQGRIDAVLSANPIDRRRIFEEAAGVSRYRQRKHETELRLARVQQDLDRLEDVTGELRTRVRSLKIQAGKAERYAATRSEWEQHKTRLVKHQLHQLGGELALCLDEIAALEAALEEQRARREGFAEGIGALESERGEASTRLQESAERLAALEGDARALDERRAQLLERVQSWQHVASEEARRAEDLEAQVARREEELRVLEEQRASLEGEVASARGEAERRRAEREALAAEHAAFRSELEHQAAGVLRLQDERTTARGAALHLEEAQGPAAERTARLHERLEELRAQLAGCEEEEQRAAAGLAEAEQDLASLEARRAELQARLEAAVAEQGAHDAERARLELEVARRQSQIESLLDRELELADLGEGARSVLEAVAGPEGPCAAQALSGVLADHLTTGTRFARALDAVLGERVHALVVSDAGQARAVAGWLRDRGRGQAALAVLGGLAPTAQAGSGGDLADLGGRVLGPLRAEVECDPEVAPIADALCRGVLLVEDLDTALEVVRRAPEWRCVTPSGELVDASGLVAGERTLAQGAIGRRSSAAELQQEVEGLERELALCLSALERARAGRAELEQSLAALAEALEEGRSALSQARSGEQTARARVRDLREGLELHEREHARASEERERLAAELVAARQRAEAAEAAHAREQATLETLEARRPEFEARREELSEAEGRSRVALTRVEEQIEGISRRVEDLRGGIADGHGELERARRLSAEASDSARLGSEESEDLARRTETVRAEREAFAETVAGLRERSAELERSLDEQRRERDAVTRLLESRSGDLSSLRLDEQRLALAKDEISRRSEEELGVAPESLLEGFEPEEELREKAALASLEREVRELKGQLDRMGPVNMEALAELEEVGGRLEFLETQIADLNQARRTLDDTLKKIEEESEKLFLQTFEEVRGNFQRIFRQLFGGGKADVVLAEGEPVLEAGVEIMARPPGREMLTIGLLSGGQRTMTALALLFAVFEARPSPFCVLDEVDAALDDANIQRFLVMLDQFRRTTQFVVVTHNKGTMARCESLYGVTMQTKGVSRQVSVQLEEVDVFVPEASGSSAPADAPEADAVDAESGEPIKELRPAARTPVEEEAPAG
jgi:chromosome segregation protein